MRGTKCEAETLELSICQIKVFSALKLEVGTDGVDVPQLRVHLSDSERQVITRQIITHRKQGPFRRHYALFSANLDLLLNIE